MKKAKQNFTKASQGNTSFASEQAATPSAIPAPNKPLSLLLIAFGVALILAALAGAWRQSPRPFPVPQASAFAPADPDWWRYPIESNPALRLPAIQGNLRGVHALADGKVWVVGEGGLILYLRFPRFFVCQRMGFMLPVFPGAAH